MDLSQSCHLPRLLILILGAFHLLSADVATDDIKEYLQKFGYLTADPNAAVSGDDLESGILKFQDYNKLPLTGVTDEATTDAMHTARCGIADFESDNEFESSGRLKRYAIASKWRKRDLNYFISQYSSHNGNVDNINKVIDTAFQTWEVAADISVKKAKSDDKADIIVSFMSGSHSTNRTSHMDRRSSFDGPGGVLAHASFPTVGEIHFDDAENWLIQDNARGEGQIGYNLLWAAIHEVGHSLGLKHTNKLGNAMHPHYRSQSIQALGTDDKEGIARLYGPPRERPVTEKPPTTTGPVHTMEQCSQPDVTDAVLTLGNTLYMFEDDLVWIFENSTSRPHYPVAISEVFPGIEGPITAAMSGTHNKVYFFRNKIYWRWDSERRSVDRGFPRSVAGFGNIHDDVIAAFRWSHNGKGYLFGSKCRYWRYDFNNQRVDPGYPISTRTWRGIPSDLSDITTAPDGHTYVFRNKDYWVYSSKQYRLLARRYNSNEKWHCCSNRAHNTSQQVIKQEEISALTDTNSTAVKLTSSSPLLLLGATIIRLILE